MGDGTLMLVGGAASFFKEAREYDQPLYNFFRIYNLEDLTFEEMQEYFLKYGTQQQRLDFSKVIDQSYIDYAIQRLGRMPN